MMRIVTLGIILRDSLGAILRVRAKVDTRPTLPSFQITTGGTQMRSGKDHRGPGYSAPRSTQIRRDLS
jgi:hypothetical protein